MLDIELNREGRLYPLFLLAAYAGIYRTIETLGLVADASVPLGLGDGICVTLVPLSSKMSRRISECQTD